MKTYFPAGYQLTEADMQEYQELFNFVTLSLDKNGEYVGCAHRHPPQQILTISASGSSWGFAPTAASAGRLAGSAACTGRGSRHGRLPLENLRNGTR
ncbi:MAG: hypothetical protein ACLSHO_11600 [Dysosmobacter sp.]